MTDWIITLPKTIKWEDYKKELNACRDGKTLMNYRLPRRVYAEEGDQCFVTWKNIVRGWMRISKVWNAPYGWTCSTTGKEWPGGWYLQRTGIFYKTEDRFPIFIYLGFRGIRRFPEGADYTPHATTSPNGPI